MTNHTPSDGPVGKLLSHLHRHPYRPAHMHFAFSAPGYDDLTTALYVRGDQYENSDAVFGVKQSLVVDVTTVRPEQVKKYGVEEGTKLLEWEFVLVGKEETKVLRERLAREAMTGLGLHGMTLDANGLPVEEVD